MKAPDFASGEQQAQLEAMHKRRRLRLWSIAGVLILASVLAFVALWMLRPAPEKKLATTPALLVRTTPVRYQTVQIMVPSQGTVTAATRTPMVTEVAGKIVQVSPQFQVGGFFRQGEVMIEIDPSDYEVALKRANSILAANHAKLALEQARAEQGLKDWQRLDQGRQKGPSDLVLRKPQLAEAEAAVAFAQADVERARRDLERSHIRAPYDALVREKSADLGQFVGVGTVLGRIVAIDHVEVRLPLSNQEMAFLFLDHGVLVQDLDRPVTLSSTIGQEQLHWQAQIVRSEAVVDVRSRMQYLVARVTDPYGKQSDEPVVPLQIGQFVEAEIQGPTATNIVPLPRHLLRPDHRVLVTDDSAVLHFATVQIFWLDRRFAYLSGGLKPGDQLIETAIANPVEGLQLRIASTESTTTGSD